MAPKVSEQYRNAKREQILRGAREALSVAPINETSTADIAAAAEVSEGTLYNYFPSKQALLVELARSDRTTPAIGQADVPEQGNMQQEFRDILAKIFDERLDSPELRAEGRLSLTWWQAAAHDEDIRQAQRESMEPLLSTLRYGFVVGNSAGTLTGDCIRSRQHKPSRRSSSDYEYLTRLMATLTGSPMPTP